jgi:hypothetical protein
MPDPAEHAQQVISPDLVGDQRAGHPRHVRVSTRRAGHDVGREAGMAPPLVVSDLSGAAWLSARCGRWWLKCATYWGQHCREMAAVDDQHPVQQISAGSSDPSFDNRIRPRTTWRNPDDPDADVDRQPLDRGYSRTLVATGAVLAANRIGPRTFDGRCKCGPFVGGEGQYGASRVFGVSQGPYFTVKVGDLDAIPGRATVAALAPVLGGSLPGTRCTVFNHFISSFNSPLIISRESMEDSADARSRSCAWRYAATSCRPSRYSLFVMRSR